MKRRVSYRCSRIIQLRNGLMFLYHRTDYFNIIFLFRNLPEDFLPLVQVLTPPLLVFWEFLGEKSKAYLVKLFPSLHS